MRHKGMKIGLFVLMGVAFAAAFGALVMALWNALVPSIFNGPVLTYWQAIGVLVLSKILFGGFGSGRRGCGGPSWKEKWGKMSEEDKGRLKEKFRNKWCSRHSDTSQKCDDPSVEEVDRNES